MVIDLDGSPSQALGTKDKNHFSEEHRRRVNQLTIGTLGSWPQALAVEQRRQVEELQEVPCQKKGVGSLS